MDIETGPSGWPKLHLHQVYWQGSALGAHPIDSRPVAEVDVNSIIHAWCGGHFLLPMWYAVLRWGLWQCYCRQMLCGLGKVRKLLPVLTTRYLSSKNCGNVHATCVCKSMLHGRETLARIPLTCSSFAEIHWICGTKDWDKTLLASLLIKIGIVDITASWLQQSFAVGSSACVDMYSYSMPRPVANTCMLQT